MRKRNSAPERRNGKFKGLQAEKVCRGRATAISSGHVQQFEIGCGNRRSWRGELGGGMKSGYHLIFVNGTWGPLAFTD